MSALGENPNPVLVSQRWFERLLLAYPREHRAEYGPAMAQLFRDQCRDAWREQQERGLLLLWLRVLPDLLKTSILEHLANLKRRKSMSNQIATGAAPSSAPRNASIIVFVLVFGLVLLTATVVTFLLPEAYAGKARVKIARSAGGNSTPSAGYDPYLLQTEFEVIQSEVILDKVIDALDLNEVWRKKYNSEVKFKTSETRQALKRSLALRPIRNTSLIDITVYSDDKLEAAKTANCIAETYQAYRLRGNASANGGISVEIIEHAEPGSRPVAPNKPLNIAIGAIIGVILGLICGWITGLLVSGIQRRGRTLPPPLSRPIQSKF